MSEDGEQRAPAPRRVGGLTRRAAPAGSAPLARLSRAARESAGAPQASSQASQGMQATAADLGFSSGKPEMVAINARVDAALRDRARTAFLATQLTESRTFSEFVERALLDRVMALEAQYNEGRPWGPTSRALKPRPPA